MAFKYQRRSQEDWEKRAQSDNFDGFVHDQFPLYKAKKGDNWVRILPPTWDNARHYGLDVYVHYDIGPEHTAVLCLFRMERKACPICEARAQAERNDDAELAKKLRATKRVLCWMINRADEKKGPMIWPIPARLDEDIAKVSQDRITREVYEIDDPDAGYDVNFEREGEGRNTRYTAAQIARKATSVNLRHVDFVVEHPLPDCIRWRDYDEIREIYEGGLVSDLRDGRGVYERDEDRPRGRSKDDRDRPRAREDDRDRPRAREDDRDRPRASREDDRDRPRASREDDRDRPRGRSGDDRYADDRRSDDRRERRDPRDDDYQRDPRDDPRERIRRALDDPRDDVDARVARRPDDRERERDPRDDEMRSTQRRGNGADEERASPRRQREQLEDADPGPGVSAKDRAEQLRQRFEGR